MSTRYLGRSELLTLLRNSRDPLAERASAALDPTDADVVPVHSGGLDRATYEVRLARAEAGEGPTTAGAEEVRRGAKAADDRGRDHELPRYRRHPLPRAAGRRSGGCHHRHRVTVEGARSSARPSFHYLGMRVLIRASCAGA